MQTQHSEFIRCMEAVLINLAEGNKDVREQLEQDPCRVITDLTTMCGLCMAVLMKMDSSHPELEARWRKTFLECMTYQNLMLLLGPDHIREVLLNPSSTDS